MYKPPLSLRASRDDSRAAVARDVVEENKELEPAAAAIMMPDGGVVVVDARGGMELQEHVAIVPGGAAQVGMDKGG